MAPITTTIDIGRPQMEVFDYVTDPTRFIEWQHGVVAGHMEADGPHGVGARCLTTRRIGFAERPVTSELTHIQRPRTWGIRGIDGPIRAIVHVTVDPLDDEQARVTIELDFTGHGIGKLLVPLAVRPQARREMPENLQRLKQRLESRSSSAPPAASSQNSR
jgi:Polyketide cyclase / dehydrase and lipid transport